MSSEKEKKSQIWKAFEITADEGRAKCRKCANVVKMGSCSSKSMNTTNLWSHLKIHHPSVYTTLTKQREKEKEKSIQQTLPGLLEKTRKWDNDDAKSKQIDKMIMEMIAVDDQPFSIVQHLGFQRLINQIEPRYTIKTEKYFRTQKFEEIYSKVEARVRQLLHEDVHCISFTTDCWSGLTESLMSLTAHWISNDFKRISVVLNVKPVNESHTGEYLKDEFFKMLEFWNIDANLVGLILRDGGSNIVKAMTITEYSHFSCMAHTLQLIVNEGLSSQRVVVDLVANLKRIATHFNHSTLAKHRLKNIQADLGLPQHAITQCVSTRWNSTLSMIRRLVEQRRALNIYCNEFEHARLPNINNEQWEVANKIVEILSPIEEITFQVSRADSAISCIIPSVRVLKKFFEDKEKSDTSTGVKTMISTMLQSLNKRFSAKDLEKNKWLVLSCMLDPRYKAHPFLFSDTTKNAKAWLQEEISLSRVENAEDKPVQETEIPRKKGKLDSEIDSIYENILQVENETMNTNQDATAPYDVQQELEFYLKESLVDRKEDPLNWWRLHGDKYGELKKLARKYLCPPPSSVASERVFSTVGNIYDDKRNCLKGENAEKLTFLHYNLRLLNFKY